MMAHHTSGKQKPLLGSPHWLARMNIYAHQEAFHQPKSVHSRLRVLNQATANSRPSVFGRSGRIFSYLSCPALSSQHNELSSRLALIFTVLCLLSVGACTSLSAQTRAPQISFAAKAICAAKAVKPKPQGVSFKDRWYGGEPLQVTAFR